MLFIGIDNENNIILKGTDVTVSKAYGKFQRKANAREISEQGCDIIIGTPGRLIDFFSSHYVCYKKNHQINENIK